MDAARRAVGWAVKPIVVDLGLVPRMESIELDGPLARDALYPGFCRLDVARLILTWVVGET